MKKNQLLLILFFISFYFSCKKDETAQDPQIAQLIVGTYNMSKITTTSGATVAGATGSAIITASDNLTATINLKLKIGIISQDTSYGYKIAQNSANNFLPYHLVILHNQLFLDMVYTNDSSIPIGSEIISINNVNASEVINQLSERQVRDGNNLTYPIWILSLIPSFGRFKNALLG